MSNFCLQTHILWPLSAQEMALLAAITRLTVNCSADSRIGGLEQLRLRRIRSIYQHTRVITLLPSVSLSRSRSSRRWRRCFAAAGNCVSRVYHQYRFSTQGWLLPYAQHPHTASPWMRVRVYVFGCCRRSGRLTKTHHDIKTERPRHQSKRTAAEWRRSTVSLFIDDAFIFCPAGRFQPDFIS
jgi:hypothetical protein